MPTIWGLHNYSDVNRLEGWRTHDLVRALGRPGVADRDRRDRQVRQRLPQRHGAGLTRAAKVLRFMLAVAGSIPQIKRLYIYDWTGGTSSTRFDAGLTNARNQPRAGYVVVCKALHAATATSSRQD